MAVNPLPRRCPFKPDCDGTVNLSAEVAAHDEGQLDLIVSCDSCNRQMNAFLALDDMVEL